jgi:phosphotriesterase-related protein
MTDIMTVTGPVAPELLGVTHSHEHVLWDYWKLIPSYDCVFDDEDVATAELEAFRAAGGGAMVDASTVGIRTDPLALRRVSERSGVRLVLGAGWYRERLYSREVFEKTIPHLAEVLIEGIAAGVDGTDVRAGVIGEIGTERGAITPAEERVFRAAARAHLETGVAILTHTTHFGELALAQIELLQDAGVATDRIVISHLGDRVDHRLLLEIAATGVYLSVDNIGYAGSGYPSDAVRADSVARLVREGYGDRVVLGCDISSTTQLATFGGHGYAWLLNSFLPLLVERGLDEAQLHRLTTANIAQALEPRT